jgi:energy-coupling factor transporter transmembrane protein EcfT
MIIDSMSLRLRIMKVRGLGNAGLFRRINAMSNTIAHELIHTIEKADRIYRIMLVRGFNGKLSMHKISWPNANDLILLLCAIGVIIVWLR